MVDKLSSLKNDVIFSSEEKDFFTNFLKTLGVDKCYEILCNYQRLSNEEKVPLKSLLDFLAYEYELSSVLYTILRAQEDAVKAFLCNTFHDFQFLLNLVQAIIQKPNITLKSPSKMVNF